MKQHYAAPAPTTEQAAPGYPHEQMDALALNRYKVVPAHESMLHRYAVVAGDGTHQLYVGRESECQNMARKFAGAFLDGAFAFHSLAAPAPTTQQAGGKAIGWQWVKDPKFPGLSHKEACRQWKPHQKHGWQWTSKSEDRWWYLNGSPETGDEDWTYRRNPAGNELPAAPDGEAPAPAAPTDKMVDAYLSEQRRVVEEADRFGRPNVGGLHTNTVREACRAGIAAAMAAQGQEGAA